MFEGNGGIWKIKLIWSVTMRSPALCEGLGADLRRLAAHPSAGDRADEVDQAALDALDWRRA